VRLRFQERPWDLILTLIYAIAASAVILSFGQGVLWAILLVLFVPGYVVVAALFPGRGLSSRLRDLAERGERLLEAARSVGMEPKSYRSDLAFARNAAKSGHLSEAIAILEEGNERVRARLEDLGERESAEWKDILQPLDREGKVGRTIDWTERIALGFGLSIAVVSLVALLLNLTPWGIRLESIVVILLLFTVLVGIVAIARRIQLPLEDRLEATIHVTWPEGAQATGLDKALTVVLAASIVFAGAVFAYVALTPRPTERFTQFYILDSTGGIDPDLYPRKLNVSELGRVIIGIVNNESVRVRYTVRVDLVGLEVVRNLTTGFNETIERNRATMPCVRCEVTLEDRRFWRQPFNFTIGAPGLWKVEFLLFRDGDFSKPYQNTLFLLVRVLPP
jgi:uncharacterized membrane protein